MSSSDGARSAPPKRPARPRKTAAPASPRRRPPLRDAGNKRSLQIRRVARGAVLVVAGALLLLTFLRVVREDVLPRVEVAGAEVGGLSEPELEERLHRLGREMAAAPIVIRRQGSDRRTFSSTGADTGLELDVEATAEAVLERGGQANPLAALIDHLRAFVSSTRVQPAVEEDPEVMAGWVVDARRELADPPREGDIRFVDTKVEPVYPKPGTTVRKAVLRAAARAAFLRPEGPPVEVAPVDVAPRTEPADVDVVVGDAETAVSEPVTLSRAGAEVVISRTQLARLLQVEVAGREDPVLELVVKPRRVRSLLSSAFAALESEPVDASFVLSGDGVDIVPSRPGVVFDPKRAARQIVHVATRDADRSARLDAKTVKPDLTTKEARGLRISERVSTFTTYHSCCEPRVANIHRAADLIDGIVVEPGETFSLNEAIGPRTTARGFAGAPAIRSGEFVEEVGGGISQLATTFFNAVFFGGYDFLEYKAHSYYISRYPAGREATISTPVPDLRFSNDSGSGIFIDTSYTETSITVSFYGNQDFEVESRSGPRTNVTKPEEQCKVNKDLDRGEEVVVQEGLEGFDIVVERIFKYPNGDERTETFSTHYAALPRIVERRNCDGGRSRSKQGQGAGRV